MALSPETPKQLKELKYQGTLVLQIVNSEVCIHVHHV